MEIHSYVYSKYEDFHSSPRSFSISCRFAMGFSTVSPSNCKSSWRNKILKSFLDDDTQFHEHVRATWNAGNVVKRNFHFIRASISSDNSVPVEPGNGG